MSCVAAPSTFRLLDIRVGWEPAHVEQLVGAAVADGVDAIELAPAVPGAVSPAAVDPIVAPARLAPGRVPGTWYLLGQRGGVWQILFRDPCTTDCFEPWGAEPLVAPVAIAARGRAVAVSDPGQGLVRVYWHGAATGPADIAMAAPGALAFGPRGRLYVVDTAARVIRVFDRSSSAIGEIALPVDAVDRLAVEPCGDVWVLGGAPPPTAQPVLFVARADAGYTWSQATLADLAAALPARFELPDCLDLPPAAGARYARRGQLVTTAIDSHVPRCRWHRVRVDADVPVGTRIEVAVATAEEPVQIPPHGLPNPDPSWASFATGAPHPSDWVTIVGGGPDADGVVPVNAPAIDGLIDQPPGRYLYVRLRLVGDGTATPTVRQIRLDLPRSTSAAYLPGLYAEDEVAEDFTERFVSLFDAGIESIDRATDRAPALLDAFGLADEALPWLASLLDIRIDPAWPIERQRALIAAAPALYKQRGTVEGLRRTIELVTGATPAIDDLGPARPWAALPGARVGSVRLFGRNRARLRLGRSALGQAPVNSYGDPDSDPHAAVAFRFRVAVPAAAAPTSRDRARLARLVDAIAPAHTVPQVRVSSPGFVLGTGPALGVDTALVTVAPPVLGAAGNIRLRRASVLWPGRAGRGPSWRLPHASIVGVHTAAT